MQIKLEYLWGICIQITWLTCPPSDLLPSVITLNLINFSVQKAEIEKLLSMYNKYVEGSSNNKLDRLKFRDILHDMFGMTDDMLMDRGK